MASTKQTPNESTVPTEPKSNVNQFTNSSTPIQNTVKSYSSNAVSHITSDPSNLASVLELADKVEAYFNNLDAHIANEPGRLELLRVGREVLALPDTTEHKTQLLLRLSNIYKKRANHLGSLHDLDVSIDFGTKLLQLASESHSQKPRWLHWLSLLHQARLTYSHELNHLHLAISYGEQAVLCSSDDSPQKPVFLKSLGVAHLSLFRRLGRLENIESAIDLIRKAILLKHDSDPQRAAWLNELGSACMARFTHLGSVGDLTEAIDCQKQAVLRAPNNSSLKFSLLNNLGNSYLSRFEHLGELEDLQTAITNQEEVLQLAPDAHPSKPIWLNSLGNSYQTRFQFTGTPADIEKAITLQEHSVQLCLDRHPKKSRLLANLGNSYSLRSEQLGRSEDIEKATFCFRKALELTPNDDIDRPHRLAALGTSYNSLFSWLERLEDLETAIALLTEAVSQIPDAHAGKRVWCNNLGISHWSRFLRLGELEDIDKAINHKMRAVDLTPDGHLDKAKYLDNLANSYQLLFNRFRKLEDLETAIKYGSQVVILASDSYPLKHTWLNNLGVSYRLLFDHRGYLDDIDKAIGHQEHAIRLIPGSHTERPMLLSHLGVSYLTRFNHLGKRCDLKEAIRLTEQSVELTSDGHPARPWQLSHLGSSYLSGFNCSGQASDIDNAICHIKHALALTPENHPNYFGYLINLSTCYCTRFNHSQNKENLEQAITIIRQAVTLPVGKPLDKLRASQTWATWSRSCRDEQLDAYAHCMALLPQVAWLGVSVQQRYQYLELNVQSMATEAAAAAISESHHELALEWLEQGRSVVWNQALQLRSPFEELLAVCPRLAQELKQVSWELEYFLLSEPAHNVSDHNNASLHSEAQRHRRLAEKWEHLLNEARRLPGLNGFLFPAKISRLKHLVGGVLVTLNLSRTRCDALILQEGKDHIAHVSLPDFSYQKAKDAHGILANCLQGNGTERKFTIIRTSKPSGSSFCKVLETLWYNVVFPIIKHLGYQEMAFVDDLPHITWCLTGLLSSLPLHAAGDYSSPSTVLSNLAISSYTPTISALRPPPLASNAYTRILTIGQSSTPGLSPLPNIANELKAIKSQARDLPLTELTEEKACTNAVLASLEDHSWVHFACHASQNTEDPLQSAFRLHDGDLTLSAIAGKKLNNARFAFLSACQTATGDKALPEESVHLAAGLLMAGYPSVIATLWSIEDNDAPLVAGEVYRYMLTGGNPDNRKAAIALHKAVGHLRTQIGEREFARWVPYIHLGR